MEPKKHKKNHVVIVTSNAEDAKVKQFQIRPWLLWLVIISICIVIGVGFGYLLYEDQIWSAANQKIAMHQDKVSQMEEELQTQQKEAADEAKKYEEVISELEKNHEVLTNTVTLQKAELEEMKAQMEQMYNPTLLPLTGGATIEEVDGEEPMCLFNATEGALVVATASGVVTEVLEDPEKGFKVSIDHGNGYVTIYHNEEEPKVKQGDEVVQGMTIYVIDRSSLQLGYQVKKDEQYINPMDVIEIEG